MCFFFPANATSMRDPRPEGTTAGVRVDSLTRRGFTLLLRQRLLALCRSRREARGFLHALKRRRGSLSASGSSRPMVSVSWSGVVGPFEHSHVNSREERASFIKLRRRGAMSAPAPWGRGIGDVVRSRKGSVPLLTAVALHRCAGHVGCRREGQDFRVSDPNTDSSLAIAATRGVMSGVAAELSCSSY